RCVGQGYGRRYRSTRVIQHNIQHEVGSRAVDGRIHHRMDSAYIEVVEFYQHRIQFGGPGLLRIPIVKGDGHITTEGYVTEVLELEGDGKVLFRTRRGDYRKGIVYVGDIGRRIGRTSL